ncbi:hypothetical protein JVU11DRAFT_10017 [Chiua virens]|nr:hypothetical protein JVU11DRAFT_10017 [Chiua virens]
MSNTNTTRESPLIRKLQAARETKSSPLRTVRLARPLGDIAEEEHEALRGTREKNFDLQRQKELEAQKARIVAQMVPVTGHGGHRTEDEQENVPPVRKDVKGKERAHEEHKDPVPAPMPDSETETHPRLNGFDAAARTLTLAFDAKAMGKVFRDLREDVSYTGRASLHRIVGGLLQQVWNGINITLTIFRPVDMGKSMSARTIRCQKFPDDLKNKVYLLKHFERYIMDRLYGDYEYTFEDLDRTKGMGFVQKYLRMKHVIVFKMSHDVLQFNFYDHSKVILSSHGLLVTHIDKNSKLTRYTLSEVMTQALSPPSADPEQAKFHQRLLDKLKYCKEVLTSIRNASAGLGEEAGTKDGVSSKASKASLR